MRKRIYMAQPSTVYGDSVYLPYTVGSLIAYAFNDVRILKEYEFCRFFYTKEKIEDVVARIDNPFLIGFSCYLWNYEYNKTLAAAIKKKWPQCITVFGGHQVSRESDIIYNEHVDIVLFGEGEESFKHVLLSYINADQIVDIPNLAYKEKGKIVFTKKATACIPQRVSPYLNGWFDDILQEKTGLHFSVTIETNRGCPNQCAFCDYGNIKTHVRLFDAAMVKAEIDWVAQNKLDYLIVVDANFGLFPRDEEFVDYLVAKKKETGFPKKVQTSFSKNNPETVFMLNKKLNDAGMSKGATLSFQSLSPLVLKNIFRQNIPMEQFQQLLQLYKSNGIATYSELILGLPGETYESFKSGLELLLQNGQHSSIVIFNCELLNNSIMNRPDYLKKHGIRYVTVEQNLYHIVPDAIQIKEYSKIVIETESMTQDQWINANILGVFVRAFHNLGLTQCFAIFLFYKMGIAYTDFYEKLILFAKNNPQTVCGRIYMWLVKKYESMMESKKALTWQDPAFGEILWPMDESVFFMIIQNSLIYWKEILQFIKPYFDDGILLNDLSLYQKAVVKTPGAKTKTLRLYYDWYAFFEDVYQNRKPILKKSNRDIIINPGEVPDSLPEYAKETIWFGRRGGNNIITDIQYKERL